MNWARPACGPPPHRTTPGLEAKVAFLRVPGNYPEPTFRVEALETHMSWVFLLDHHVYKLKKPVRHELLDFRTLAARHRFCLAEVKLNERLAAGIYLGLATLTCNRRGHLAIDGRGSVVDWLVRMRRLPAERMLDYALVHGTLADDDLRRLAARLVAFYRGLDPEAVDRAAWRERFRLQIEANRRGLASPLYGLPSGHVRQLARDQHAALDRLAALLDQRVLSGCIVEGHGDLRPEHVFLGDPVAVIDCLEFSRMLRLGDPADELAFLAMECERLGSRVAGQTLLQEYATLSGDAVPGELLHFYQSCRAGTRALIAARHLLDARFRHSPHWMRRAGQYLQLAEEHVRLAMA